VSNAGLEVKVNVDTGKGLLHEPERKLAPVVVLKVIGQRYLQWIDDNFRDRGTEKRWAPLRPLTLQTRKHGGDAPLQDTGSLRQSFVESINAGAGSVRVGTEKVIASYQHEGTHPYVIVPRTARALAARLGGGGFIMFGKRVNHPGLPERRLIPSKALAEKLAVETFEGMIEREAQG
jgi:hypothetical protein